MAFTTTVKIKCNGNEYAPASDDLTAEAIAVAKKNGIIDFNIKINGTTYDNVERMLPTNSISALKFPAEVIPVVEVKVAQDVAA